jgi:hypothetical protein
MGTRGSLIFIGLVAGDGRWGASCCRDRLQQAGGKTEMTQRADVIKSPAYAVLRAPSRRLLRFIEYEIARNGGRPIMLYNDQFAVVGSVRVIAPGLSELHVLGLIEVTRYPKRHMCALSERWRDIASKQDASIISARARSQRMPPMMVPSQPATS